MAGAWITAAAPKPGPADAFCTHLELGAAVTPLLLPCAEFHVFLNICRSGFYSWANARLFAHALLSLNSY